MPIDESVDLELLGTLTDRFTGADLQSLCREAAFETAKRSQGQGSIALTDFQNALQNMTPSITDEMLDMYSSMTRTFGTH